MKNLHYIILLLLTMAVGCDNLSTEGLRNSLTIYASQHSDSRTSFDGTASTWSEGDQLMTIVNYEPQMFQMSDPSSGRFVCSGEVASASAYDVYALYAASDANAAIDPDTKSATVNIGAAAQTQSGNSPAHIASFDPLYGKAEDAEADNIRLTMYHTAAAFAIEVKNSTKVAIAGIESVEIEVSDDKVIYGYHQINLQEEVANNPISAASGGSNSIMVTVENSGEVADGGSFTVWAATAPFALASGEKMNIKVTTTDGKEYEFEKVIGPSGASFVAGGIVRSKVELPAPQQEPEDKPEEIIIEFGDVDGGFVPEGLPTKGSNVTSGEYELGKDYIISIKSDVPYYRNSFEGNEYIKFENIANNQGVQIGLPVIEGYVLKEFTLTTMPYSSDRKFKYGIVTSDLQLAGGMKNYKNINTSSKSDPVYHSASLSETDDKTQYFIYIYRDTNNTNKANFDINKVTLTYTLEK